MKICKQWLRLRARLNPAMVCTFGSYCLLSEKVTLEHCQKSHAAHSGVRRLGVSGGLETTPSHLYRQRHRHRHSPASHARGVRVTRPYQGLDTRTGIMLCCAGVRARKHSPTGRVADTDHDQARRGEGRWTEAEAPGPRSPCASIGPRYPLAGQDSETQRD